MEKKSKRLLIIFLLYSVVVAGVFYMAGYKFAGSRAQNDVSADVCQTFYATISDIQDHTLTVKGLEVNDINFRGDFLLSVAKDTKVIWRYTEISLEDLKAGHNIAITFTGDVREIYPAQITQVLQIQLLDDE